jgi:phosphoribosylformimino-5-aminoimidazole carboxamide ribotide isomerase
LTTAAKRHPDRLIVAADVRGRKLVTRGWQQTLERDVLELIAELNALPLGGVLVTAVHKEGQLKGTDLPLMAEVCRASRAPVLASGGISSRSDLQALADSGVVGAVLGMALYTNALDAAVVAKEFSS